MSEISLSLNNTIPTVTLGTVKDKSNCPADKNELLMPKTSFDKDSLNKVSLKASKNIPSTSIEFKDEKAHKNDSLVSAVTHGALIKGAIYGGQYLGAGIAVGLGSKSAAFNVVPNIARNSVSLLKTPSVASKAAIIGLTAGAVGLGIGVAKGAIDGVIVNSVPSKKLAIGAMATTSALASLPAFKISKTVGVICVASSIAMGAYYGNYVYDKSKNSK